MGIPGMRFVAWNCAGGLRAKWAKLTERIDFDVAVLSECSALPPAFLAAPPRAVSQVVRNPLAPLRSAKHLGVFARAPWKVEEVPDTERLPWLVHARVTDTRGRFGNFDVLAVWGLSPKFSEKRGYAEQTSVVIKRVLSNLAPDHPVVLAGDLNTPIASNKRDALVHADNVQQLGRLDLISAFTASIPRGSAKETPTHYWRFDNQRRFHIDHVFVPYGWCDREGFSMNVGSFDDWVKERISDHVPLTVNVPLPRAPKRKTWADLLDSQLLGPRTRGVSGSVGPSSTSSGRPVTARR